MRETTVTRDILRYLKGQGGFWLKISGGPSQVTGIPDILGCYRGRFVGIEVKLPGKLSTVTDRQRFMLERIEKAGGYSIVAQSVLDASNLIRAIDSELDS